MDNAVNNPTTEKCQKSLYKQPISCPWSTIQPYPSTSNKQETSATSSKSSDKSCPSIQQSSSQFFYFLRLMQLFPETHPATLHTVLCLCNNNFFYAVDKLLYARKCKALYNQSQRSYRRCPYDRSQPHCNHGDTCRSRRDKVLDLKVPQSSTSKGSTSEKSSKRDINNLEEYARPSTSNCSNTSQSLNRESTQPTSFIGETIENNRQSSSSRVDVPSEETIENYSLHSQSIIQDSDIVII